MRSQSLLLLILLLGGCGEGRQSDINIIQGDMVNDALSESEKDATDLAAITAAAMQNESQGATSTASAAAGSQAAVGFSVPQMQQIYWPVIFRQTYHVAAERLEGKTLDRCEQGSVYLRKHTVIDTLRFNRCEFEGLVYSGDVEVSMGTGVLDTILRSNNLRIDTPHGPIRIIATIHVSKDRQGHEYYHIASGIAVIQDQWVEHRNADLVWKLKDGKEHLSYNGWMKTSEGALGYLRTLQWLVFGQSSLYGGAMNWVDDHSRASNLYIQAGNLLEESISEEGLSQTQYYTPAELGYPYF